jgi:hypothetical protein
MKPVISLIFFINLLCLPFLTHSQSFSDQTSISIITCGPGSELYSSFGHSAIRVKDPKKQ